MSTAAIIAVVAGASKAGSIATASGPQGATAILGFLCGLFGIIFTIGFVTSIFRE
jgi:hypothetical protein